MNITIGVLGRRLSFLLFLMFLPWFLMAIPEDYDVIIKSTTIIDGTGRAPFQGDIAIRGEKIVTVGHVQGNASLVIDGSSLTTCPGFVDPHSHADLGIRKYPLCENLVMQGITTFLGGNCGDSPAPQGNKRFGEWLLEVEKFGISINYAPLVGHNTMRRLVMGDDYRRRATAEEIERMRELAAEAMKNGAFGFSVGLDPGPGHFAGTEEIVAIAQEVEKWGGFFDPHTRGVQSQWSTDSPQEVNYGVFYGPVEDAFVGMYKGYLEAIEVARRTGIRTNIAHMDNAYMVPQPHPDSLEEAGARATLNLIESARAEGLEMTFDMIPCEGNISGKERLSWGLFSKSPALDWVYQMAKRSRKDYIDQLKTKEFREKVRSAYEAGRLKLGMIQTKAWPYWMDYFKIMRCQTKTYEGKTIAGIAKMRNTDALEAIFDIILEDPDTIWVQFLDPRLHPATIPIFIQYPQAMPGTDAPTLPAELDDDFEVSPTAYSLYPHYIRKNVREKSYLSLEEAIRKATSLPAQVIGLENRGILKAGNYADILIFDYKSIKETGDYMKPDRRPEGIEFVLVNGNVVYKDRIHTGQKPGKVIRHNSELRKESGGRV